MSFLVDFVPRSLAVGILQYCGAKILEQTDWEPKELVRHLQKEEHFDERPLWCFENLMPLGKWNPQKPVCKSEALKFANRVVIWKLFGPTVEIHQSGRHASSYRVDQNHLKLLEVHWVGNHIWILIPGRLVSQAVHEDALEFPLFDSVMYEIPPELRGNSILSWQLVGVHAIFLTSSELVVCTLRSFQSHGDCRVLYSLALRLSSVKYILASSLDEIFCVTDNGVWVVRRILENDDLKMLMVPRGDK